MSRIPAGLLYLTIYNPTLRPVTQTTSDDDEDAEEQAHILFYTARERAVSRDRMLRQVGLAKALINFSEMFNPDELCENVHSQTRRMIMVSPESNYWIHACFEVARTPRNIQTKNKDKEKGKGKGKGKGKAKENVVPQEVTYDYHDGSIHDLALRAHILRGYEQFKLTHGSFASILTSTGQQALELQLERFFTIWAWKWDVEEDADFSTFLGIPVHPFHRSLTHLLDEIVSNLPEDTYAFALLPPYVIPSSKFSASGFPPSLTRHIISRIPRSPPVTAAQLLPSQSNPVAVPSISSDDGRSSDDPGHTTQSKKFQDGLPGSPSSTFLAMPNVNLDMRQFKWNWPGYLTFGKQSSAKPSAASVALHDASQKAGEAAQLGQPEQATEGGKKRLNVGTVDVDKTSLQEAISSHTVTILSSANASPASSSKPLDHTETEIEETTGVEDDGDTIHPSLDHGSAPEVDNIIPDIPVHDEEIEISSANATDDTPPPRSTASPLPEPEIAENVPPISLPTFLSTTVHLAQTKNDAITLKKRVWHITSDPLTFALVTDYEYDPSFEHLPTIQRIVDVLTNMQCTIEEEEKKADGANAIPTATKILQPQDRHIVSIGDYTISSTSGFISKSEHLFNGQHLLQSELDIVEVFSRGLNPQHWHIARRGISMDSDHDGVEGAVYMEVARKESSLNDVDNELAGVVRKFADATLGS